MNIREIKATANMAGFGIPNPISGVLFGGEDDAHKFIIREMSGQAFSGTVTAKFLRYADNVTVPLTGSIEDGAATVTLIENCYTRPGRFKLTVYVTADGSTTAIYCCMGTIDRTDGASTIDPSGEINLDVTDLINQINTATASIPADYSDLLATIAPTYSNSSTYAVGDYVWYDGDLYRCTTAISTAESWTAAHWETAVLTSDVSKEVGWLKSAVQQGLVSSVSPEPNSTLNGYVNGDSGNYNTNSAYKTYKYDVSALGCLSVTATGANSATATSPKKMALISFLDAQDNSTVGYAIESNDSTTHTETVNVPSGAVTVCVSVGKDYVDENGVPAVTFAVINAVADRATKQETIKGDAITPTYLAHRYLNSTGTPTSSTSNSWNLYKIDVSNVDDIDITTYCSGASKPMWAFYSTVYSNANVTAMQDTDNIVAVGDAYAVDGEITSYVHVPAGAKTMSLACYASQADTHMAATAYEFGDAQAFVQMPIRVKALEGKASRYAESPYYRNVRWGAPMFGQYYHSEVGESTPFVSTMTAAEYFAAFNALVEDYSDYVTATEMGTAGDETTTMYCYTFDPLTNEDETLRGRTYKRPKIIISAGQHGFEKVACFGLYWFVKDLLENWEDNETLAYIRNHVQLIIMPLLNPYGFNHDSYTDANGVNLNRNWGTTGWSSGTEGSTSYGGPSAFSEVETQYARDVILDNLDALWLCDFHNNGQTAPNTAAGYLWQSFHLVTYDDPYFEKAINAAKWHIDETTGHLYKDYPTKCSYAVSGSFSDDNAPSHQGLIVAYAREHNIMAATMEGAAAFIGEGNTRWQPDIQHMNADLIGNWLRCLLATYSKLED